jgi:hypothetical protein
MKRPVLCSLRLLQTCEESKIRTLNVCVPNNGLTPSHHGPFGQEGTTASKEN